MIIKVKRKGFLTSRLVGGGEIREIFVNENLEYLDKSKIEICFRGKNSSGILILDKAELDNIQKTVGKVKIKKI